MKGSSAYGQSPIAVMQPWSVMMMRIENKTGRDTINDGDVLLHKRQQISGGAFQF